MSAGGSLPHSSCNTSLDRENRASSFAQPHHSPLPMHQRTLLKYCGPPVPSSAQSRNNPSADICMHPSHPISSPSHFISSHLFSAELSSSHNFATSPIDAPDTIEALKPHCNHTLGSLTSYPCRSPLHHQARRMQATKQRTKLE